MVDGALFQDEVNARNISSVPAVYAGDTLVHIGKASLGDLLAALEEKIGAELVSTEPIRRSYDLIVVGGGPSGIASAIYSARKGLHVAVVAERIGGQVNETTGIENIPSVSATTGTQLAADLRKHAEIYHIDLLDNRRVEAVTDGETKLVKTNLGEELSATQVILATGASWRKLGVPGEAEYIGRGVAFCPHCDGPFFKDKDIAVIGGGNSGIEAAIDLAGICRSVVVLEYMDTLRADIVLQEKLATLPNVTVRKAVATKAVLGDGTRSRASPSLHVMAATKRRSPSTASSYRSVSRPTPSPSRSWSSCAVARSSSTSAAAPLSPASMLLVTARRCPTSRSSSLWAKVRRQH